MIDHLLAAAGKGILLDKSPVGEASSCSPRISIWLGSPIPMLLLVSQADKMDAHRIETLQLGAHRIDCHLVGRGQQDIGLVPAHGTRAGSIPGEGAIHDGEDPRVNILLDLEQIDQCLVDQAMGPVAIAAQQASKGVFHCAGDGGEDMRLDRG